ncbi:formyltetrahydrofolate deformylase, partial [Cutibacterium acnes]
CLLELLWSWSAGDLYADIAVVVSNHPDMRGIVEPYGIPYVHIPVTPDTKPEAERRQIETVERYGADMVVLARYMQIIPPQFIELYRNRMINIHHSFLPAFIGGNPYKQAYGRGVKLIGATAHYVTPDLDEGPIIEQETQRVSHSLTSEDFVATGRDIESRVLARAVKYHLEGRVMLNSHRTVVFAP